jgi:methylmalonyl-CoA mutase
MKFSFLNSSRSGNLSKIEPNYIRMPQNSIHSKLRETFLSPDKEVWKQFASQELEGKNPDEALSWNSESLIRFFAYYDPSDEKKNNLSKNFRITVADDPYFGPAKWLNVPFVTITSEETANQTALQHLTNGADGILFSSREKINIEYLLQGIDWRYCSLFFIVGDSRNLVSDLKNYISMNALSPEQLSGGLFWDTIPNSESVKDAYIPGLKNVLHINSSTPVREVADALSSGAQFFEQSASPSVDFFTSIAFSLAANNSFLETIAKLKALRFLWYQVAMAYGFTSFSVADLHLHVRSEKWIDEKFQPHGNLLKSTAASMASIIGGANSITIHAEDSANSMMNRIARNVSNLLREESHLDKAADPSAGAYAIDAMTEEFAKHAWKIFQEKQTK